MSSLAMSVKTVAAQTELSETTIRDAINKQELPAIYVGRMIRVLPADVETWLGRQRKVGEGEQ